MGAHEVSGYFLYPGGALRAAGALSLRGEPGQGGSAQGDTPVDPQGRVQLGRSGKAVQLCRTAAVEVGENELRPIPLGHVLWSAGLTPLGKDVPGEVRMSRGSLWR